jgi:hypothetical protein
MGILDWVKGRGNAEEPSPSRSYSLRSDLPERVLRTEADVKIDNALAIMTVVVDEISRDPSRNWQKCRQDFEKAVADVREAFEPNAPKPKQPGEPFERGDRIVADEPFLYGGKPKLNPDTPGIVDGVYDDRNIVCYHRLGMPPGNVPVESVRHASEQDLKKYETEFATLEAKLQHQNRGLAWDR